MPMEHSYALTMVDILIRMCLAVVCGALIGMEREQKRRPAGLRTHILICLGASMTTLTLWLTSFFHIQNILLELLLKAVVCLIVPNLINLLIFFRTEDMRSLLAMFRRLILRK